MNLFDWRLLTVLSYFQSLTNNFLLTKKLYLIVEKILRPIKDKSENRTMETSFVNEENYYIKTCNRSSHQRCSITKGVLRNFAKFTEKHLCQSLFLNKVAKKFLIKFLTKLKFLIKLPANVRTRARTYGKSLNNRLVVRPKVLKSTEAYFIARNTKCARLTMLK